jgi:excisionase family DNA binding protein
MSHAKSHETKLGYSIQEAIQLTSLSRSTIYNLIATGDLRTTKIGRRVIILPASIAKLLEEGK